jgi:hypothetical protein
MLPDGVTYPILWPLLYRAKDGRKYACNVVGVHTDGIDPYYTIDVLEGPVTGERQTVTDRLSSWIDVYSIEKIRDSFNKFNGARK